MIYRVHYYCSECGGSHPSETLIQSTDSKLAGCPLVEAYPEGEVSNDLKMVREKQVTCPNKHKSFSPDSDQFFLELPQ
jgi:hypothetical protein